MNISLEAQAGAGKLCRALSSTIGEAILKHNSRRRSESPPLCNLRIGSRRHRATASAWPHAAAPRAPPPSASVRHQALAQALGDAVISQHLRHRQRPGARANNRQSPAGDCVESCRGRSRIVGLLTTAADLKARHGRSRQQPMKSRASYRWRLPMKRLIDRESTPEGIDSTLTNLRAGGRRRRPPRHDDFAESASSATLIDGRRRYQANQFSRPLKYNSSPPATPAIAGDGNSEEWPPTSGGKSPGILGTSAKAHIASSIISASIR